MKSLGMKKLVSDKRCDDLTKNTKCHLDPDIYKDIIKPGEKERKNGWKSLFGQREVAQGHLNEQKVQEGDLFLFFGWFKETYKSEDGENYLFDKSDKKGRHIIFGYLQIGERIQDKNKIKDWMKYHPHYEDWRKNNTLYVARDTLSWDNKIPGAGVFKFKKELVLTKNGLSHSKWNLPDFFKNKNISISYHSKKSWKPEGYFQSVGRGQEFVITSGDESNQKRIENWAKQLISNQLSSGHRRICYIR